MIGPEELFGALDGEVLGHVHVLATAVISLSWVALSVLVGEDRTLRFQHRSAHVILGGDKLDLLALAALLVLDSLPDLGINLVQRWVALSPCMFHLLLRV